VTISPLGGRPLTEKEDEILALLAQGLTQDAVARQLGVSVHTVRSHCRNIFQKLRVHNVAGAVSVWLQRPVSPDLETRASRVLHQIRDTVDLFFAGGTDDVS
jgi:DNA-binding CsgD family transcriptional regulator